MAERRMLAKTIIDSDAFLEMPVSCQNLYFHLNMRADDDGFVNKPKSIMRMIGCKDDDMNLLIMKKFILTFESGVIVIKHWRIHNYIQKDRYIETKYKEELSLLELDENKSYRVKTTDIEAIVNNDEPQEELFFIYEREFKRPLSNNEIQKINYWRGVFDDEFLIEALRQSIIYSKISMPYIDAILVKWKNKNLTLEQLNNGEF